MAKLRYGKEKLIHNNINKMKADVYAFLDYMIYMYDYYKDTPEEIMIEKLIVKYYELFNIPIIREYDC